MKVGDYVRYKRPFDRKKTIMIGKIIRIYEPDENHKIKGYDLDSSDVISDEFSIKSSPNIIDLIEVGDYANGKLVTHAEDVYTTDNIYIGKEVFVNYEELIIEEDIESMVTKEQFSQMEYKIGE